MARSYAKGGGTVYRVEIRKGTDINEVSLDPDATKKFIKSYVKVALRPSFLNYVEKWLSNYNQIPARYLVNICVNMEALTPSNTNALREFLVESGADYSSEYASMSRDLVVVVFNPVIVKSVAKAGNVSVDDYSVQIPDWLNPSARRSFRP